jgi:hypothetical protein
MCVKGASARIFVPRRILVSVQQEMRRLCCTTQELHISGWRSASVQRE